MVRVGSLNIACLWRQPAIFFARHRAPTRISVSHQLRQRGRLYALPNVDDVRTGVVGEAGAHVERADYSIDRVVNQRL